MITLILTAVLGSCVNQQAVVAQQYVAPVQAAQVLYFVGAPLRVQSMVEHAKRTDPDYTEFLEFKAWKAGKAQAQQQSQAMTAEGEMVPPPNPEPISHVRQHCAKCHSGDTPREFILDGQPGMRPQDITASIRKIVSGEMPKDHKLSREQKNLLLQELLSLEQFTGEIQ